MYVSYAAKKKAFGFQASIQLLRLLIWLLTQLLYLPLIQMFFSLYICKVNQEGDSVHYLFGEVYCWSGEHMIMCIVMTINLIVLVAYTLFCSYMYFNFS